MNNEEIKKTVKRMAYAIEKFKAERIKLVINELLQIKENDLAMDYVTELWKGYTLAKQNMEAMTKEEELKNDEDKAI